jgi:hypothetical protein
MPRYVPLNKSLHAQAGWQKYTSFSFAARDAMVPLVLDELAHALPTLPLAFRVTPGTERYELVVVLSLHAGTNLFVQPDGQWVGGYVPAAYRGAPFRLLPHADGPERVFCIDTDSEWVLEHVQDGSQRFFDDAGNLSALAQQALAFWNQYEQSRLITQQAVDTLTKHRLIMPWSLQVSDQQQATQAIEGLYRIDENALRVLPLEDLDEVRQGNGLVLAYAQLFAQHRIQTFSKLYAIRQGQTQEQRTREAIDASRALLDGTDDIMKFNFH